MLGTTVPEPQADGRVFVCSAGYSPEMRRLIRIYPLSMQSAPRMWSISRVALEANPRDSRDESYCLKGDRKGEAHRNINSVFEHIRDVPDNERAQLISVIESKSKKQANKDRCSLAIIQPDYPGSLYFSENVEADDHPQMSMFAKTPEEKRNLGSTRFPYQPRVSFFVAGHKHNLQLRDWGSYEWLRKYGPEGRHNHPIRNRLASNPRLLIGNMNAHRNVWLVISVLKPVHQLDLFANIRQENTEVLELDDEMQRSA